MLILPGAVDNRRASCVPLNRCVGERGPHCWASDTVSNVSKRQTHTHVSCWHSLRVEAGGARWSEPLALPEGRILAT